MGAIAEQSDAQLLHAADTDGEAFAEFYRRHSVAVVRYLGSRGLDADSAADLVADVFMVALERRRRYRPEHENARLWLLGIATNKMADEFRRRAVDARRHNLLRSHAITLSQTDRDTYDELVQSDEDPDVAGLADLPDDQQRAIRARIVEDREYAEIAREMGLTEAAVRKRVSRGLTGLRGKEGGA